MQMSLAAVRRDTVGISSKSPQGIASTEDNGISDMEPMSMFPDVAVCIARIATGSEPRQFDFVG